MTMKAIVVLALVACVVLGETLPDMKFISGKNLTNAKNDFKFRFVDTYKIDGQPLVSWISTSVDPRTATGKDLTEGDMVMAFGLLPVNVPPLALAVFGKGKDAVEKNLRTVTTSLATGTLDADLRESAVGVAVQNIMEIDNNGHTIKTYNLHFGCNYMEGTERSVSYRGCRGKHADGPEFTLLYVATQESGIINYGEAPVSPRSFEMILEGKGFTLQSPKNHLRAEVLFFVGSGKDDFTGDAQVLRINETDVYAAASSHAIIDNELTKVELSVHSSSYNIPADDLLVKILRGAYDLQFSTQALSVDFPVGKTNFIYDPAVGAGVNVYKAGANVAVVSIFAMLLSVVLALF